MVSVLEVCRELVVDPAKVGLAQVQRQTIHSSELDEIVWTCRNRMKDFKLLTFQNEIVFYV